MMEPTQQLRRTSTKTGTRQIRPHEMDLRERCIRMYQATRATTMKLMAPLSEDDYRSQPTEDVSPPYWNMGHTSWFFVQNVLREYGEVPSKFASMDYVLNSYYEGLGPRLPRSQRGQITTPSTSEVAQYREDVDQAVIALLASCDLEALQYIAIQIQIGCQHEQQHQELFVTEILHIRWSQNPHEPRAYRTPTHRHATPDPGTMRDVTFAATESVIGYQDQQTELNSFCWDNELPAHKVYLPDFAMADRLITNLEWQAFIEDGGYQNPMLWLSNGWQVIQKEGWQAPMYWQNDGTNWQRFSLLGLLPVDPHAPVSHVSFYEADAFARWYSEQDAQWRGARLPRESEWEHAARKSDFKTASANLLDDDIDNCSLDVTGASPPREEGGQVKLRQLAGTAWEWASSHYEPYPGYQPFPGTLTEYNGKFMDNQRVLRGGSFATPRSQARVSYRNFWPPQTRFQASSLRLLRDIRS